MEHFDSFGVEHISEEIEDFIGNKNIKANIFWIQEDNSIMYGYFCKGFIDCMLAGKKLSDYTIFFSPHDFKKKRYYNFISFQKWMNAIPLK